MKIFTRCLLGTSANAEKTKIKNPYCLEFYKNDAGELIAEASEPLQITNNALGYRIEYVLQHFAAKGADTKYAGSSKFYEIESTDQDQILTWRKQRRRAYNGSLRHFLAEMVRISKKLHRMTIGEAIDELNRLGSRNGKYFDWSLMLENRLTQRNLSADDAFTVLIDTLQVSNVAKEFRKNLIHEIVKYFSYEMMQDSPFRFTFVKSPFRKRNITGHNINLANHVQPTENPGEYRLKFHNYIGVKYPGEKEELNFLNDMHLERGARVQISDIKLEAPSIIIEEKGRYWDTFKLHIYGYWAWERLAESLPYEYSPDAVN